MSGCLTSEPAMQNAGNMLCSTLRNRTMTIRACARSSRGSSSTRSIPRSRQLRRIPLRVVVHDGRVRVVVGQGDAVALDVRELRTAAHGQVGLYVDNGSDGVFANVHIIHGS